MMSKKSEIRMKGEPRRQVMVKRSVIVEGKVTWLTKREYEWGFGEDRLR